MAERGAVLQNHNNELVECKYAVFWDFSVVRSSISSHMVEYSRNKQHLLLPDEKLRKLWFYLK